MDAERTFWEKATAAHVYCRQARLRGERYSRHWYDLAAMSKSGHAQTAIADSQLAKDYSAMLEDGLLQSSSEIPFSEIMNTCADLESAINRQ